MPDNPCLEATSAPDEAVSSTPVEEIAQRFQIISELTSDFGYCFRVDPDGSLILEWMTESVTRIMGYTIEEINARGWQSFLYPEDLLIVLQQWQRLLSGQTDVSEYRVWADKNTLLWLRNHARPVWDEAQQRVVRIYGAAQDITEKKQAEQQMARDKAQIEALNVRLRRAMRESSHRIKNNLQMVACLIDLQAMEHQGALPADRVEQLGAHIRALAAVHTLLTQDAHKSEQAQSVSAKLLLERLCALIQQTAGERHLHCRVQETTMPGRQATSLALVANELIQNGLKYSKRAISVAFELVNGEAVLEVGDDGVGLPADFDWVQAANIGLQLVQDITASDLQGQVRYANAPVGGARVTVTFPHPTP